MKNKGQILLNVINLVICILILIVAVFYFSNEKAKAFLFPVMYLFGAALSFINGANSVHGKNKAVGIMFFLLAVVLLIVAIFSYVTGS